MPVNEMTVAELDAEIARTMTEAQFAKRVHGLLRIGGWRWCHFRPARTEKGWRTAIEGDAGFPDIVAVRNGRLLFAELKSARGTVSAEQDAWAQDLIDVADEVEQRCLVMAVEPLPVDFYSWRPKDLAEIARVLAVSATTVPERSSRHELAEVLEELVEAMTMTLEQLAREDAPEWEIVARANRLLNADIGLDNPCDRL